MSNYYSYKRISTDTERQNFARQIKALERYAKENKIEYLLEFTEEKSAKDFTNRPEFNKLEKILQPGDTVVFKDLFRFTRETENGYAKYMDWFNRGINMVFIDNPVVSTDYIRQMVRTADQQDVVTRTAMQGIIKLLIIVELNRGEQQRLYISKSISDGIAASHKKNGRSPGHLDKLTPELSKDIKHYLLDRTITQNSLLSKHKISRNTLKKYINIIRSRGL